MTYILLISANSDIGKACACIYAQAGYSLYLASRKPDETRNFAQKLEQDFGINTQSLFLDTNDYNSHASFVDTLFEQEEIERPVGVILCTGYLGEQALAQQDFQEAQDIINTNFTHLTGLLEKLVCQFEKPGQKQAEDTRKAFIAVISSVAGERGRQSNYIYGAAKAALSTYLSGLRNRCHDSDIQVITVKPGFVKSKMTANMTLPRHLSAQPEDVAKALFKAQQSGKDIVYTKAIWCWIMYAIRLMPEPLFKRLKL